MSKNVDVLAVIDCAIESAGIMLEQHKDLYASAYQDNLMTARASFVELMEAVNNILSHNPAHYDTEEESALRTALARVRGEK